MNIHVIKKKKKIPIVTIQINYKKKNDLVKIKRQN
jgi:hypothetical protein